MKKYLLIPVAVFAAILFLNFNNGIATTAGLPQDETIVIPDDVQEVIDNSCFGCHHSDSKNKKAKMKLKFDELGSLKTHKLVGKLQKIGEEVHEGKMPPKKFNQRFPDKVPTMEQKELLINWAEKTAKSYVE